ncbi:hypothetical protein ACFL1A_01640 [Patescibacteria group bacterium]
MKLFNFIPKVYAQTFGTITNPLDRYGDYNNPTGGVTALLTNVLRFVFVAAGIYALFNFVIAGYQYMMAAGDTKKLSSAWDRIWQTIMGLVIVAGSFVLAALIGFLVFGDAGYILNPVIWGPG